MFRSTSSRIGIAGAVTALSLGIAVPALAQDAPGDAPASPAHHKQPTLAEAKAWATSALDRESTFLTKAKAAVAANTKLTDAQKTALTAKIDKALTAVATAKTAVDNATTVAEVKQAVEAARPDLGLPRHDPKRPAKTLAQQKADAAKRLDELTTWLDDAKAKVAADDTLTDAQKAAVTAKIDKALAAVAKAKTDAASATTEQELHAALDEAHVDFGGFHGGSGPGGQHRAPGQGDTGDDHGTQRGRDGTGDDRAKAGTTLAAAHPGSGSPSRSVTVRSDRSHDGRDDHGTRGPGSGTGSTNRGPSGGGAGGSGAGHDDGGHGGHGGGDHDGPGHH